MGDYGNRGQGGRGGNRFGGGNRGGGRFGGGGGRDRDRDFDRGPREMFQTVCDDCGNECEVPFRPSGEKPVFCSSCFEKRGNGESEVRFSKREAPRFDRGGSRNENTRGGSDNSELLQAMSTLNAKLDKVLKVIEAKLNNDVAFPKVIVQKAAQAEKQEDAVAEEKPAKADKNEDSEKKAKKTVTKKATAKKAKK